MYDIFEIFKKTVKSEILSFLNINIQKGHGRDLQGMLYPAFIVKLFGYSTDEKTVW